MLNLDQILYSYPNFEASSLKDRFFKYEDILKLIHQLPQPAFDVKIVGSSHQGRAIHRIKWGKGKLKIFFWSQMHGDEATGTMAIFDMLNFLGTQEAEFFESKCELHFIPMVNPDGAEVFTRRNAQQIDVNRDYLQELTKEAKLLKSYRKEILPDFGFNLHDQNTLWSVSDSLKPATLSFLAPAFDKKLQVNDIRKDAMLVIAEMYHKLEPYLPGNMALFDDEFEPRAFGDNFQLEGTRTILIEAGGHVGDPEKQQIRRWYFLAMLSGLISIVNKSYIEFTTSDYFAIPKNNKQIFHLLIQDIEFNQMRCSIGINFDEIYDPISKKLIQQYSIQDIGDLSFCEAYRVINGKSLKVKGEITFNQAAHFELLEGEKRILAFQNGLLV